MTKLGIPVVVTTEYKGVFFGYAESSTISPNRIIRLHNARMCIYWPESNHGVLGLAHSGPMNGARITPAIPAIELVGVTSIMEMSPRAVKAWEKEPWRE